MKKFFLGFLWLVIAASYPAQAADYFSPRIAALGGAGHAGPLLNDAIYLNPSYASFLPTYALGLNYLTYTSAEDVTAGKPQSSGRNYSVSIQDGRSDMFQAGVAYTLREDGSFVHVGASKSLIQRLGVGIGAKFFFNNAALSNGKDLILSTTGVPLDWLQVAGVVDNLLETSESKARGLYREYILGTKVNVDKILLIYIDPHYPPSLPSGQQFGHEAGVEFVMMSDLFLRLGQFNNASVPYLNSGIGRGYGLGAGWVGPRLSLDYGLSRAFEPRSTVTHSFGLTAYF